MNGRATNEALGATRIVIVISIAVFVGLMADSHWHGYAGPIAVTVVFAVLMGALRLIRGRRR